MGAVCPRPVTQPVLTNAGVQRQLPGTPGWQPPGGPGAGRLQEKGWRTVSQDCVPEGGAPPRYLSPDPPAERRPLQHGPSQAQSLPGFPPHETNLSTLQPSRKGLLLLIVLISPPLIFNVFSRVLCTHRPGYLTVHYINSAVPTLKVGY